MKSLSIGVDFRCVWLLFCKANSSSEEVIDRLKDLINGGFGFKKLSEEPLESNHKYVRQFRENLARKTNQIENLTDVSTRLWVKSDPIVRSMKREIYCTLCEKFCDHTIRSSQCPQKILYSPRQSDDVFFNQFLIT